MQDFGSRLLKDPSRRTVGNPTASSIMHHACASTVASSNIITPNLICWIFVNIFLQIQSLAKFPILEAIINGKCMCFDFVRERLTKLHGEGDSVCVK